MKVPRFLLYMRDWSQGAGGGGPENKLGVGHNFRAREKGWVKNTHAIYWGWVMGNYASILSTAGMYTYKFNTLFDSNVA